MNKEHFQNEKLVVGELPPRYLPRQHIMDLFKDSERKRLIFLKAPGGYGKTSATIHWLQQTKRKVLWVSLDEYDNLPTLFYKLCCQSLLIAQPDNQQLAAIVTQPDFPSSPVEYTILALQEFANTDAAYTLVLDDFHLITNPKILKSLPFILKRLSLTTTIVILSRQTLPLEIAEHYATDKILSIDESDLTFSLAEVTSFFELFQKSLTPQDSHTILQQTAGWPMALKAIAYSHALPLDHQANQQELATFIEKQMWDKWSPETQDTLLRLSILDEITPELYALLIDTNKSQEHLDHLALTTPFIRTINQTTYRYHDLFQQFLQEKLSALATFDVSSLYHQVALHYLTTQDIFKARQAAIKSGNEELILTTLLSHRGTKNYRTSVEEYVDTFLKFQTTHLTEALCQKHPGLNIFPTWYYFLTGQGNKMTDHLDFFYLNLPRISQETPELMEEVLLICGLDPRQGLLEKITTLSQLVVLPEKQATPAAEAEPMISLTLQLPFLHRGLMDYYEISDEAKLAAVEPHFRFLLQQAYDQTMSTVMAGLACETNDLQAAYQLAYSAYAQIDSETLDELRFSVTMHLLHVHYLMGNSLEFQRLKEQLTAWLTSEKNYYLYPNFFAYEARLAIWQADTAVAQDWLDNYFVTEPEKIELYKLFQHFTTLRAFILLDKTHEALVLAEKLVHYAKQFKRLQDETEGTVLLAIIYWNMGNHKQSLSLMEAILLKSQPYNLIRAYADEGAALLPILTKLKNRHNQLKQVSHPHQRYLTDIYQACYHTAKSEKGISPVLTLSKVTLSKQQRYMIQLLSKGYKFADIVNETHLSINTIRSHVSIAYQKLQVNNATDAIAQAKKHGLL